MCSIVASFNGDKFEELVQLNQFRGNFSYSYLEMEPQDGTVLLDSGEKMFGEFPLNVINKENNNFKIGHLQAPTGGMVKDPDRIHPVEGLNSLLWHNGLVQPKGIKFLQKLMKTDETFDTKLISRAIGKEGFSVLSKIEGLFSCVFLHVGRLYLWRTKHGKLYVDDSLNISSERFEGSKCINADTIYKLHLDTKSIEKIGEFTTKKFNVVIKGEL